MLVRTGNPQANQRLKQLPRIRPSAPRVYRGIPTGCQASASRSGSFSFPA